MCIRDRYSEADRDELKKVTEAIHENGGKAAVQIWHGGFVPADFFDKTNVEETPDTVTVERIHEIIKQFGESAKLAVEAGFDALEFHGAHTYLPHEFMNPSLNNRTDEYGNCLLYTSCNFLWCSNISKRNLFCKVLLSEWRNCCKQVGIDNTRSYCVAADSGVCLLPSHRPVSYTHLDGYV